MKLILFLFSIYLVSLSLLPCNDTDDCTDLAKTELHKNHSPNKKPDTQNDQCTPFCSCTCCGIHGFQFQNHIFLKDKNPGFADTKKQTVFYVYNNYQTIYLGIWQPPKLG